MTSTPDWVQTRSVPDVGTFVLDVDGQRREVTCRPDAPLLYVLRNDLGLKGSRFGCGLGQCGACTVLVDGRPAQSCALPVSAVGGSEVRTVEGLADDAQMQALQRAFLREQAAQCGYCTSGLLVAACALLKERPAPERPDVDAALERHLCRCGSHGRVVRAVLGAAGDVAGAADVPGAPDVPGADGPGGSAGSR